MRVAILIGAISLGLASSTHAQLSRFQPTGPAPVPPNKSREYKQRPLEQWTPKKEQQAWYKKKLWCDVNKEKAKSRKACRE